MNVNSRVDTSFFLGKSLLYFDMIDWFQKHITQEDLHAFLLLAGGFFILYFLPDMMIGPYAMFNPYKTWFMVMIISGISFAGYVAIRVLGSKNGILMTGALGGLISSTAVSISLSGIAKSHRQHSKSFAAGIIMACTLMFIRVLLEVIILDISLLSRLLPAFAGAALFGALYGIYLYRDSEHFTIDPKKTEYMKNPLQISTSLKFGLLFGLIYGMIKVVSVHFGDIGVYLVSGLSGITDVDAITLSLSTMAHDETLVIQVALLGIALASAVNTVVKTIIVYYIGGVEVGTLMLRYSLIVLITMGMGVWSIPLFAR